MLVGGILCYVFRQRVQTTMQQEMLRTIRFYGDDRAITRAWDDLQEGVRRRNGRRRRYSFGIILLAFSYAVAASPPTMTGDSTGSAESFPAVVVKRSTER